MFLEKFNLNNANKQHFQFLHQKISESEFNKYIIKSIFDDDFLYKYVTNYSEKEASGIGLKYPVAQLISLIKNLKYEYIAEHLPKNTKKKLCKKMKPKINGKTINTLKSDWENLFNTYLDNNITGYDVVAEIILSKIIEEKFGANVLVAKLAQTTNTNMRVFGIDVLHYNDNENSIYLGESKLTSDLDLGVAQHTNEIDLLEYKLLEEIKLFALRGNDMKCKTTIKTELTRLGRKQTEENNYSLKSLIDSYGVKFGLTVIFFIAHGDIYDYDDATRKVQKIQKNLSVKNVKVIFITLPIIDKNDFISRVEEVLKEYE